MELSEHCHVYVHTVMCRQYDQLVQLYLSSSIALSGGFHEVQVVTILN